MQISPINNFYTPVRFGQQKAGLKKELPPSFECPQNAQGKAFVQDFKDALNPALAITGIILAGKRIFAPKAPLGNDLIKPFFYLSGLSASIDTENKYGLSKFEKMANNTIMIGSVYAVGEVLNTLFASQKGLGKNLKEGGLWLAGTLLTSYLFALFNSKYKLDDKLKVFSKKEDVSKNVNTADKKENTKDCQKNTPLSRKERWQILGALGTGAFIWVSLINTALDITKNTGARMLKNATIIAGTTVALGFLSDTVLHYKGRKKESDSIKQEVKE